MGRIPEDTIQEVRDRADIVALIGRYVELKQSGRNWKGRCPFHEEKTPSFNVNPDRGIFHCFGCQKGGNAITFSALAPPCLSSNGSTGRTRANTRMLPCRSMSLL